jgi:signal transduction histidine kinase
MRPGGRKHESRSHARFIFVLSASATMEAVERTPGPEATVAPLPTHRRLRAGVLRLPSGLRMRILALVVGLLGLATVLFVGVTYTVLEVRLENRIDADLNQEAAELRRLAGGRDPRTGDPFARDVRRIFDVYFQRNVPSRNEAMIALVDGEMYLRSRPVVPYRLHHDRALVQHWASLTRQERGGADTPAGRVDYLAVPVSVGGEPEGVFVAAFFRDRLQADYDATVVAAGAVGVAVLLLGSLLAWRLAGRVVDPVTRLTKAARTISETDLSRRIPVEGRDEVAQQAATFNEMLDRLERAFQTQRQFIDDAGHQLRTPLTIVLGNLELLPEDPDERRETVVLLTDELERMSRIVRDLLLLAKREQADFLELGAVEIGGLTDELATKAASLAPREWHVESRGQGIAVADRQRVTEAVLQLAENAVKHAEGGGPLWLGSSVEDGTARIWVRDEGSGIPLAEQSAIFDRFRRAEAASRSRGSGLGLPIVKAIAEAHGGRVELESTRGRGSKFTIVIPVDQQKGGET